MVHMGNMIMGMTMEIIKRIIIKNMTKHMPCQSINQHMIITIMIIKMMILVMTVH